MASTDILSMGVATRTRKRAREAAFQLLPALQDPRDRKKSKAELSPELSQILAIARSPTRPVSHNDHVPLDDFKSASHNNITLSRTPIELIDLTVDRHTNQSNSHVSSNTRITRSASRRAQLQAKLAQESTQQPAFPPPSNNDDAMDVDDTTKKLPVVSPSEMGLVHAIQQQNSNPALQGTREYISLRNSGGEVFPSCVINTSGSEDYTAFRPLRRSKTPPSSYLAPNPVRRAPRISSAKRDTARYLLEATEKAALLAYRETRREFPRWMSNPSRTFFRGTTYIPGGLPIRYPEADNDVPMHLGTTADLASGASHFISTDAFTLQLSPTSYQASHVQLDPDLDPSPLLDRTSPSMPLLNDSLGTVSSLSLLPFPSDLALPSAPPAAMYLRTKKGLWYNYAVSVQHANQISSASSCGFIQNDNNNTELMSFENDMSIIPPQESMYDAGKDDLNWMVPPYYSPSREHMQSTTSSYGDSSSLGAMNSYFKPDLLPLLESSCMTTGSLLTEWNMDCTVQPPGLSFSKTLVDSVPL